MASGLRGMSGKESVIRAESVDGGGVVLLAGAEDCRSGEIGMIGRIRAVLGFQTEAGVTSIGGAALAAFNTGGAGRIELDGGLICQNFLPEREKYLSLSRQGS